MENIENHLKNIGFDYDSYFKEQIQHEESQHETNFKMSVNQKQDYINDLYEVSFN